MKEIYYGRKLDLLLTISSAIVTAIVCNYFLAYFTKVTSLELIVFSSTIGFGIGTIAALIILSLMSIFQSGLIIGLLNLLGLWFWSGSYIAIVTGGTTGSIVGAGCAISTRLWN